MKNIKIIALWIFLWVGQFTSVFAQNPVLIKDNERLPVGKELEYFIDTTNALTVSNVVHQAFTPCKTEILNLGNTEHPVWMRFSVISETDKELYLEINAPLLNHLEVYELNGDSPKQLFTGGSAKPFKDRPVDSENWLLDLKIAKGDKTTIYIKGQSYYPFQVPIALSTKNKFVENNQLHNLFWGLYLGVMLFAFIYNFFIYLSVKERYYLYYLLYILGSVAFYLGLEGFAFQFIWANKPGLNPLVPVLVSFTNGIITLFTLRFLRIEKDQKILFYWGWGTIIVNVLIAGLDVAGVYAAALGLSQLFSLLACVYFIVAGIASLRRGIHTAKYFLIGWSAYLVLVITFILSLNNVIPSNFFTTHGLFMGHMAEVVLLSFALADRINVLKKENENKQREIIIQLEENQQLQTKVNRELEQKVTERTAEVVAQKERSDELLLNILPVEVADELKLKGSTEAKSVSQVTVLFTDFQGFTKISENLSAESLVSELNYCFSAFDNIMLKYGIEKIKTIGDSYMAVGGLPTPNQTHAMDVVKASLEIQQFMQEYKKKKIAAGETFFETRIGLHTGSVVAGVVGLKKFAYDIWGDTVNIASRMESSGEIGKVNISHSTYEIVKDKFRCVHRGKISAKGKGEMDMYFIEPEILS